MGLIPETEGTLQAAVSSLLAVAVLTRYSAGGTCQSSDEHPSYLLLRKLPDEENLRCAIRTNKPIHTLAYPFAQSSLQCNAAVQSAESFLHLSNSLYNLHDAPSLVPVPVKYHTR